MMALWMAYAVVVSALLGGAGEAGERCLRFLGRPGRWGVAGGMLASVVFPAAALLAPRGLFPESYLGSRLVSSLDVVPLKAQAALSAGGVLTSFWSGLDSVLLPLWILGSLSTVAVGVFAQRRLIRSALECSADTLHGTEVRRTRRLGPAVVGCLRGIIILPEWARSLEAESLRLSLAHEREHLRSLDPLLLFGSYLLVGLQPWNPALWWQLSNLKRSIEADCDRRVLAEGADPRVYASLLMELASRRSRSPLFALPLGKPRSKVGRRIVVMANGLRGVRPRSAAVAALCAAGLLLAVVQTPTPGALPFTTAAGLGDELPPSPAASPVQLERSDAGQTGPRVARGDDARRIVGGLRETIERGPSGEVAVEVHLDDGSLLRIASNNESSGSPAVMVTMVRPGSSERAAEFRRLSLRLDIVDDEPVFTLREV